MSLIDFIKIATRPMRRQFYRLLDAIRLAMDVRSCRCNYARQILRCRQKLAKGEKLNVMFLVSELSKWKTQSLYDCMKKSEHFDPFIAISCRGEWRKHPEYKVLLEEAVADFCAKGMKYVVVADFTTMCNVPLAGFSPDIVFYEQPYDWSREYMPVTVSHFALTAYIPYCVPTNEINIAWYDLPILKTLFLYILLNDTLCENLKPFVKSREYAGHVVGLGHTFYDAYADETNVTKITQSEYVIYAPHWSFDHPNNVNRQNISTFLWNGREILAYAKAHPEVKWLFKPHPRLQWQLVDSGVWTKDEVDDYYNEWNKIGECYYGSDYVALFNRSRAMITDCSSFVAEYPPCGGAMIHLRSATQKTQLLKSYRKMYDSFYQVHNLDEMYKTFDMVIVSGEDPKREERMNAIRELKLVGNNAAKNIVEYLLRELTA